MTLTTQNDFAFQLSELDKIAETCKKLMNTPHYKKLGEEGVHVIMARAKALGLHPFEALNGGFYIVQGKVGMSTEMMAALVRQRGHSVQKDPKSNNEICILHGKRADNGDVWTCVFSKADAEAALLWNTATWKKYPAVMLYNRCMSMLFRQLFPDISLGAGYAEDEINEITKTGDYAQSLPVCPVEVIPLEIKKPSSADAKMLKAIMEQICKVAPEFCRDEVENLKAKNYASYQDMPMDEFNELLARARDKQPAQEVE